jgi:hypothetical protein
MLVPYILLIFHMTPKGALTIDSQCSEELLKSATQSITGLQDLLQGKYSRATTLMNNFRVEMEAELIKLKKSLALLQGLGINHPSATPKSESKLETGPHSICIAVSGIHGEELVTLLNVRATA